MNRNDVMILTMVFVNMTEENTTASNNYIEKMSKGKMKVDHWLVF